MYPPSALLNSARNGKGKSSRFSHSSNLMSLFPLEFNTLCCIAHGVRQSGRWIAKSENFQHVREFRTQAG